MTDLSSMTRKQLIAYACNRKNWHRVGSALYFLMEDHGYYGLPKEVLDGIIRDGSWEGAQEAMQMLERRCS